MIFRVSLLYGTSEFLLELLKERDRRVNILTVNLKADTTLFQKYLNVQIPQLLFAQRLPRESNHYADDSFGVAFRGLPFCFRYISTTTTTAAALQLVYSHGYLVVLTSNLPFPLDLEICHGQPQQADLPLIICARFNLSLCLPFVVTKTDTDFAPRAALVAWLFL